MVLCVYVNDVILVSNSGLAIQEFKIMLDKYFKLKDLDELKFFLGLEVAQSSKGIYLSLRGYILKLQEDVGYLRAKTA